jgi:hypothetical protein
MDTGFGTTLGAKDNGGVKDTGMLNLKDTPRKQLKGKGNHQVGGAVLGLVRPPVAGKLDSTVSELKPSPGVSAKKTLKSTAKKQLEAPVEKAQMPSSTLAGMAKPKRQASEKAKARAQLVKQIMKEKSLSLPEASKYIKANNLM